MGGERMAGVDGYLNARPGYEVRNLIASANILGQDGQQKACEDLLTATRVVYKGYAAELKNGGMTMTDGTNWRAGQIAGAQPVTDKTADLRPDQLLDLDLRNAHDEALGSVHDLVVSPKTGKIAYLIIARGGLFGIDQSYVPVPWDDFKVTQNVNLLVLDTTKALMTGAPEMTDAQLTAKGQFAAQSKIIDAYWQAHPITKVGG
jgi:sporulation protein YlmC with PRC-barrel domain